MTLKQIILNLINSNIRNKVPKVLKSEHADVEEALLDAIFIPFEVKQLDCTQQFINDNFNLVPGPNMGLGKNIMLGFAMCNGNNGTKDRRKRTAFGYDPAAYVSGPDFSDIDGKGGATTVTLTKSNIPKLDFTVQTSEADNGETDAKYIIGNDYGNVKTTTYANSVNKDSVNAAVNIMPPYLITLFVQRVEI